LADCELRDVDRSRVHELDEDAQGRGTHTLQLDTVHFALPQATGKHGLEVGAGGGQNNFVRVEEL